MTMLVYQRVTNPSNYSYSTYLLNSLELHPQVVVYSDHGQRNLWVIWVLLTQT